LRLSVSLAVALAFADASIVVLALPQIMDRLHTSISPVIWVIAAYNLALIAGALAIMPLAGRLTSRPALIAGLAVFGFASLGAGVANALGVLVALRCVQGIGGARLLSTVRAMLRGRDVWRASTEAPMNKYVVIYTGLPAAIADREVITAAWKGWFARLGEAVVDTGNPFASCKSVAEDGSIGEGGSLGLTGYSILTAESLEAAAELVKECPGLANAAIEVYETVPFG
jgi:MFS family permease